MSLLRALRYECSRMFFSKRWWIVPVVAGLLTVSEVQGNQTVYAPSLMTYHLAFNAWDAMVRATQTWLYLFVLVAPLLAFIVGESYLRDRSSNTIPAIFSRVQSRTIWWTAKVLSMFVGAFVYTAIFSLASLLVASCFYPFAWHFSSFQLHPVLVRKALRNYSDITVGIPEQTPLPFLLHMLLYSALSFGTYATAVLTLSLRVRKPGLPALILWGMGIGEFYLSVFSSHLWTSLHSWLMQARLSYVFVNQTSEPYLINGVPVYTLSTSLLYCLVLSALLWLISMYIVQHDDL